MKCGLCHETVEKLDAQLISGIHVCPGCLRATYLPGRLTAQGLHLGYSYRTENGTVEIADEEVLDNSIRKVSALAQSPYTSRIHAKFVYESLLDKLGKVFEKELQMGDKEFDKTVFIKTSTLSETEAFLSRPGVRSSILELIRMNAEISLDDNKIYLEAINKGPIDVQMFVIHAALLLHYLAEFTQPSNR